MSKKVYVKTAFAGGGENALDGLDGSLLNHGDLAIVTAAGIIYFYALDHDNSNDEFLPLIIPPDKNYGTKRWLLQGTSPAISTDHAIPKFNGTTGILQNTGVLIDDSNDIYTTAWTNYTASVTWVGFNPATPDQWALVYYKKIGKTVFVHFNFYGTSNTTTMKISLPVASAANDVFLNPARVWDNSAAPTGPGIASIAAGDTGNLTFYKDMSGAAFTNSNYKGAKGFICYQEV